MTLHILDDNPADLDLLGFDAVVTPIVEAICRADIRPLTVGLRGGWGTGKSTLLTLIRQAIDQRDPEKFLVLRIDPWEFEDAEHLRSTLVEMVLNEIRAQVNEDPELLERVKRLLGRVRFGKIAASALRGLATVPLDGGWGMLAQLVKGMSSDVEGFVAPPEDESKTLPATMQGFRTEFGELIRAVNEKKRTEKVIVLVDDLDRCLPDAVVESLEAIKLFLSVERMVFVIAADETMVRSAIAASIGAGGRSAAFADFYLEKIVQLPLSIPALTPDDAVTYATLLLASQSDTYDSLRAHCAQRRSTHQLPLLDGAPHDDSTRALEVLARQICSGLSADAALNPRRIKRFLNSFAVRRSIAASRAIELSPSVAAKLMLLEENFLTPDFRILAATPGDEMRSLLARWEQWARDVAGTDIPEGISKSTKDWARSEPLLSESDEDIASYMALAAALTAVASGGGLSGKVARAVDDLVASRESEAARRSIISDELHNFQIGEIERVVRTLADRALSIDHSDQIVRIIIEIAEAEPGVARTAAEVIESRLAANIEVGLAAKIATSSVEPIRALASSLLENPRSSSQLKTALRAAIQRRP